MTAALSVHEISVSLPGPGGLIRVVDRVSLNLERGEMVGLAGESGCGKSMLALAIMGLLRGDKGHVEAKSVALGHHEAGPSSSHGMVGHRGKRIAMVFQEPTTALDPVFTVGWQISAVLRRRFNLDRAAARDRTLEALSDIGFSDATDVYRAYPHQLSGGMRQLVMIAMATAIRPEVLIADEPTTALDVTTQQQAMAQLRALQRDAGTAVLLITHDIGLIAGSCSRIMIMYSGQIVESARYETLFQKPLHPYSAGLLAAVPRIGSATPVNGMAGHVARLTEQRVGCRFAERCARAIPVCRETRPTLLDREGRMIACHHPL